MNVTAQRNGARELRASHRYNVEIIRTDGTPVYYPEVKHVMYQAESLLLITGEHDRDRKYVRYPAHIIDHVIVDEIPNDDTVAPDSISAR